jgi:tetratricopeptide (TPR) repeat protein
MIIGIFGFLTGIAITISIINFLILKRSIISKKYTDNTIIVAGLKAKGYEAIENRQWDDALEYFLPALNMANTKDKGLIYNNIANCYFHKNKYDESLKNIQASLEIAKTTKNKSAEVGKRVISLMQFDIIPRQ